MEEPFSALLESVMEFEKELKLRMEVREAIISVEGHVKALESRIERLERANGRHPNSFHDAVIGLPEECVTSLNIKGRGLVFMVSDLIASDSRSSDADIYDLYFHPGMQVRYKDSVYEVRSVERSTYSRGVSLVVSKVKDNE